LNAVLFFAPWPDRRSDKVCCLFSNGKARTWPPTTALVRGETARKEDGRKATGCSQCPLPNSSGKGGTTNLFSHVAASPPGSKLDMSGKRRGAYVRGILCPATSLPLSGRCALTIWDGSWPSQMMRPPEAAPRVVGVVELRGFGAKLLWWFRLPAIGKTVRLTGPFPHHHPASLKPIRTLDAGPTL